MNDAFPVRRIERVENLGRNVQYRVRLERTAGDAFGERLTFEKFHRDVGAGLGLADVVNDADVGMVQG